MDRHFRGLCTPCRRVFGEGISPLQRISAEEPSMAKKEGMTAGAIVLAGALLHPFAGTNSQPKSDILPNAAKHSVLNSAPEATGEGPWTASCHYWASARYSAQEKEDVPSASITHDVDKSKNKDQYSIRKQAEPSCFGSNNRWGIPTIKELPNVSKISAAIAIVPDPLHAHAALDFDRTIDALLQAASDNGYVESYFWLPWDSPEETAREAISFGLDSKAEKHERERQPGLIVLKHVPRVITDQSSGDKRIDGYYFSDVVYLFLVSGTPVQGIYAPQLENALKYEGELQCMSGKPSGLPNTPSFCRTGKEVAGNKEVPIDPFVFQPSPTDQHTLAIIGPHTTGEAASLWAELQHSSKYVRHENIVISGQTSSPLAALELTKPTRLEKEIYVSFRTDGGYLDDKLRKLIGDSGQPGGLCLLIEDGTALGRTETTTLAEDRKSKPPAIIRFPRGISLLRNAHPDGSGTSGEETPAAPSPFLKLSLRDTSVEDTVTHFSPEQTPLSQEASLMAIVRQLRRYRTKFVAISATDDLDEIFLAGFLHRTLPDIRLISLGGGDLLYERDSDNIPFIGGLTLSTYNLLGPVPSSSFIGAALRPFSSEGEEAVYNSASYIFWNPGYEPQLGNYRNIFNRHDFALHPSLWLTAIGRDGYAPLGKVADCASNQLVTLPAFRNNSVADKEPHACTGERTINLHGNRLHEILASLAPPSNPREPDWKAKEEQEPVRFPVNPALSWFVICAIISALCLTHLGCLYSADIWSPLTRDLAIEENDEPCRRSLYIHIGAVMLFCMAWVSAYPLLAALSLINPTRNAFLMATVTLLSGLACLVFSLKKTLPHTFGVKEPLRPRGAQTSPWFSVRRLTKAYYVDRKSRDERPSAIFKAFGFFHALSLLAMVGIPALWTIICEFDWWAVKESFVGEFFSYRCLTPLSGVSPLPPILLLLSGWFIWSTLQTRRLRFSANSRPRLPGNYDTNELYKLYVTDEELAAEYRNGLTSPLFRDITGLLITRELLSRHVFKRKEKRETRRTARELESELQAEMLEKNITYSDAGRAAEMDRRVEGELRRFQYVRKDEALLERKRRHKVDATLLISFLSLFVFAILFAKTDSLEHILFAVRFYPTPYELLLKLIWFPLVVVIVTGWIRMLLIWSALHRGVLFQLETRPIRSAFNRSRREGWPSMMRQSGLEERWREMSRSLESMRQMSHDKELIAELETNPSYLNEFTLKDRYSDLVQHIDDLLQWISFEKRRSGSTYDKDENKILYRFHTIRDRPDKDHKPQALLMYLIESEYANFATCLLQHVLVPYWKEKRTGMVETEEPISIPVHARKPKDSDEYSQMELHAGPAGEVPPHIQVAEEFIVIRYISLIRAVLVNLRQIMTFISAAFALTLVAWNSYPFRPREYIDTAFTGLLILLMGGIIWVFAQMHRDPILNRITKTESTELGGDFYLRVAAFGAAPLLTWLAYQFPTIGNGIMKFIQPGLEVIK
jgi:hypothetical protein